MLLLFLFLDLDRIFFVFFLWDFYGSKYYYITGDFFHLPSIVWSVLPIFEPNFELLELHLLFLGDPSLDLKLLGVLLAECLEVRQDLLVFDLRLDRLDPFLTTFSLDYSSYPLM